MSIEKTLNIKFNKKQKAAATAIRWLLNDGKTTITNGILRTKNRQTGRTELVLALIIEKALKNRGQRIPLFDHAVLCGQAGNSHLRYMKERINKMLAQGGIRSYQWYSTHPCGWSLEIN